MISALRRCPIADGGAVGLPAVGRGLDGGAGLARAGPGARRRARGQRRGRGLDHERRGEQAEVAGVQRWA